VARLLVIGAGGYGRAVAEAVQTRGTDSVVGFVDDRWPDLPPVWGIPVVGRLADLPGLRHLADAVVLAIGDNQARAAAFACAESCGFPLSTVVHPWARVSPSAVLGRGVGVMAGAIVGTEVLLGDGAIVNAGVVLDHHAQIGRFGHLSVGACVGGGASLADGAWLHAGNSLRAGQHLPAEASEPPARV
jgi:sugar O-acyltransferase (sialic acid O-acetyltransferase NeuD family)